MADKKPISRMNKSELEKLAKKEGVEVPEGASKEQLYEALKASRADAPESEVPPTSGPDDVASSAEVGGPGSIDPNTGETIPVTDPDYTGGDVPPAETLFDGGPQPPQPTGSDEGGVRPLDQTSAPGFKTEGAVAAAKAEAKAGRKAAREAAKEREAAERAAAREPEFNPGISVSQPRAVGTFLTITGEKFPPRTRVDINLSHSRTPTGERVSRTDPEGTVQISLLPAPGKQSVTFKAGDYSASAEFEVAE